MANQKTVKAVEALLLPITERLGLSVWDIEFVKEGPEYYLRVYIDKENGGIGIDDCEAVSRALSDELDRVDPIEQEYVLEVSSAGMDRQLKRESDFLRYIGHEVDIKLYAPLCGTKEMTARLDGYSEGVITIDYEGQSLEIELAKTVSVRLAVIF